MANNNDSARNVFIFDNGYRTKPAEDRNIVAKVIAAITILVVLYLNDELRLDNHNFQVVGGVLLLQSIFEIVSLVKGEKASIITGFLFTAVVLAWYVADDKTSSSTIILAYLLYLLLTMNIMFNNSYFECKDGKTDNNIYAYMVFLCAFNSLALLAFTYKDRDIGEYSGKIFTVVLIGALVIIVNLMTMLNTSYMADLSCKTVNIPTTTHAPMNMEIKTRGLYYDNKYGKQEGGAINNTIKALVYNMIPLIGTIIALGYGSFDAVGIIGIYMFITTTIVLTLSDYCPNTICNKNDPYADNKVNEQMQKYKYMIIYALLLVAASCITDNSNDKFSLPILFAVMFFAMLLSSFNFQDEAMRIGLPVGLVAITLVFIVIAKYGRK